MSRQMPARTMTTKLSLPADPRFLGMAQGYVSQLAKVAGYSAQEGLALELAAEEAFMNIIKHAFPGQRPGDVFWEGEITQTELVLSIRDEGLPFDLPPAGQGQEEPGQGLGLRLIRHAVDEARFENLGRQGKALRLRKRLPQALPEPEPQPRRVEPAPPQHYSFRPMLPQEAPQVARLFWMAYGYSYKNEALYRPEGVLHLVGSGRLTSILAVAENGEVAGHAGLLRPEPVPMAETAMLAVSPAHRGRGLAEKLGQCVEAKAREMGLEGLSASAVTSHSLSQRELVQRGERPCGLELAAVPPHLFKALEAEGAPPQRESYLRFFQFLGPPPPALAHLPKRHQPMVARVYESLARPCRWGQEAPAQARGSYQADFDKNTRRGSVRVHAADQGQWPEILRVARDLEEIGGAEVVYLDLPLAQPASALLCQLAEDAGFFFAGLRPCEAPDGDYLRLQRLGVELDLSRLCLHPELGQELLAYVAAEMAEARGKPRG